MEWDAKGDIILDAWWGWEGNDRAYSIWANDFFVYVSTTVNDWGVIADKTVLAKWSYSGIFIDSSWPWWGDDRQYIPEGIFGWD